MTLPLARSGVRGCSALDGISAGMVMIQNTAKPMTSRPASSIKSLRKNSFLLRHRARAGNIAVATALARPRAFAFHNKTHRAGILFRKLNIPLVRNEKPAGHVRRANSFESVSVGAKAIGLVAGVARFSNLFSS